MARGWITWKTGCADVGEGSIGRHMCPGIALIPRVPPRGLSSRLLSRSLARSRSVRGWQRGARPQDQSAAKANEGTLLSGLAENRGILGLKIPFIFIIFGGEGAEECNLSVPSEPARVAVSCPGPLPVCSVPSVAVRCCCCFSYVQGDRFSQFLLLSFLLVQFWEIPQPAEDPVYL